MNINWWVQNYVEQNVDPFLNHTVKRVLDSGNKGLLPIDICQLLGNSDIVQEIPEGATSDDLDEMWLSTENSAFDELRKGTIYRDCIGLPRGSGFRSLE